MSSSGIIELQERIQNLVSGQEPVSAAIGRLLKASRNTAVEVFVKQILRSCRPPLLVMKEKHSQELPVLKSTKTGLFRKKKEKQNKIILLQPIKAVFIIIIIIIIFLECKLLI